jgi:two-component sensor histidine kinase
VSPPSRGGFGSRLIRLELTHELSGEVELIYEPVGLKVMMGFPLCGALAPAQSKQGFVQ